MTFASPAAYLAASGGDPTRPAGRTRWALLGILFAATTIDYSDRFLLSVLKPTIMVELRWGETDHSRVVLCF